MAVEELFCLWPAARPFIICQVLADILPAEQRLVFSQKADVCKAYLSYIVENTKYILFELDELVAPHNVLFKFNSFMKNKTKFERTQNLEYVFKFGFFGNNLLFFN